MADRTHLEKAKQKNKTKQNDEFYTLYKDVKFELDNYKDKFKDKIILCNCNDKGSAFERYFTENDLGIKELIITEGRFQDNLEALKRCDIIATNPPFSQFREFIDLLVEYDKDFIVWGNINMFFYKNIFPLFIENKIKIGATRNRACNFKLHESYKDEYAKVAITVFTTFDIIEVPFLPLTKQYSEEDYLKYDKTNVIECKTKDIPQDYNGIIGVPISFINRWNKEQFEIIGEAKHGKDNKYDLFTPKINGKEKFTRVLIKHKR